MSQILKIEANEAGQYPVTLYGIEYLIEPVAKSKASTKTHVTKNDAPSKPSVDPEEVGQPVNDIK